MKLIDGMHSIHGTATVCHRGDAEHHPEVLAVPCFPEEIGGILSKRPLTTRGKNSELLYIRLIYEYP
jgi:hypothetical protein